MPKIIQNIRQQLILEAKKQIEANCYSSMTIRSIAKACNVATGTVYNYFNSKEVLIASVLLQDWQKYLKNIEKVQNTDIKTVLFEIYNSIVSFAKKYNNLFTDDIALKDAQVGYNARHNMLREQLAKFIYPFMDSTKEKDFSANFIIESLICWSIKGVEFEKIYALIEKII